MRRGVRRGRYGPRPVRLVVARCEVTYTGRLTAYLPEAIRLLVFKADGSVLVHADSGGYKPLNWMTPPTVVEDGEGAIVVRKRAGRSEDRLEILSGLEAGDSVVASGTFLVDAESNLGTIMGGMGDMPGMDIRPPRDSAHGGGR